MNRSDILHNVLAYLELRQVTITDLILFFLVSKNSSHPALLHNLVSNVKIILSSMYFHPAPTSATCQWAHDAMCALYAKQVWALSRPASGWHFSAAMTDPSQVRDFRIEDMVSQIRQDAPELWSLVRHLLRGVLTSDDRMEVDDGDREDSDAEYWEALEADDEAQSAQEPGRQAQRGRARIYSKVTNLVRRQQECMVLYMKYEHCP